MLRDVLYALALGFAIGALTVPTGRPARAQAPAPVAHAVAAWPRLLPAR